MTKEEVEEEINRALRMLHDGVWTFPELKKRIIQIMDEAAEYARFQSFIRNVLEMRRLQLKYWNGDKSILGKSKGQEALVDKLSREHLKRMGVTDIDAFMKKLQQGTLM